MNMTASMMSGNLRRKRPQSFNLPPLGHANELILLALMNMIASMMPGSLRRMRPQSLNLPPTEACKCFDYTSKSGEYDCKHDVRESALQGPPEPQSTPTRGMQM